MTEVGQTDDYKLSDHIKAIIDHAGTELIDYCIYDTGEIIPEFIKEYHKQGEDIVEADKAKVKELGIKLIQRNLSTVKDEEIVHDPDALANAIIELICDDLKFRDLENDSKYLLLDSKLKESKRKLKAQERKNKKIKERREKKKEKGIKSKFFEKYNDRIESIKEDGDEFSREKQEEIDEDEIEENVELEEVKEEVNENVEESSKEENSENFNIEINEEIEEVEENKEEIVEEKIEESVEEEKEKNEEVEEDLEYEVNFDLVYDYSEIEVDSLENALDWIADIYNSELIDITDIKLFNSSKIEDAIDLSKVENIDDFVKQYKNSDFDNISMIGIFEKKPIAIGLNIKTNKAYIACDSKNKAEYTWFKDRFKYKYEGKKYVTEEKPVEEERQIRAKSKRNKGKGFISKKIITKVKHEENVENAKVEKVEDEEKIIDIVNYLRR